jgi:2-dehydro-3-deoxygluconokinase
MSARHDVVTIGEAMALFIATGGRPLRNAERFLRSVAGAESNVAVGVARLGLKASWCGRVGDDALGHGILDRLRGEGVDLSRAVIDGGAATGVLVRDGHGERTVDVCYARAGSAGSRLNRQDIDQAWVAGAQFLHFSGITAALGRSSAEAVAHAAQLAGEHGTHVSLDLNLRRKLWSDSVASATLSPLLPRVDTLFAGDEELLAVSAAATVPDGVQWAFDQGATTVVVKSGSNGATAYSAKSTVHARPPRVTVVDPVGAGDAFVAGYLAAAVNGVEESVRLTQACRMGAAAVQVVGDIEGLLYGSHGLLPPVRGQDIDR